MLITGGTKGIGLELVNHYSSAGHKVSVIARSKVEFSNPNICQYVYDFNDVVTNPDGIRSVMEDIGDVDVLINNAAFLKSTPLLLMSDSDIFRQYSVNVIAPVLLSKYCLRRFGKKNFGRIVNISSMAHKLTVPGDSVYASSKIALENFAVSVNKEFTKYNISCNNIGISATKTGMLKQITGSNPEAILAKVPHGNFAKICDIITAIDFFINKENRDFGGQTLYLGGIA
ncbi:SDR family oxidoreductase [Alphaproteobacteria bacterium]|nr:SDR family oxidoreductase [Alphaproteobacteria bacterium]